MANGLDRLERLLAYKRKASPSSSGRASPVTQATELQFPSPSFIRPKTSRMTAREEVRLKQATGRSPSVPDICASQRCHEVYSYSSGSTDGACHFQQMLARPPPASHRPSKQLIKGLREFQFPKPPSRNGEALPMSLTVKNNTFAEAPKLPSPRSRSPLQISIPQFYDLDTPPGSDFEDNGSNVPSPTTKGPKATMPTLVYPPTPGQSPQLRASEPELGITKSVDALDKALFKDREDQFDEPFDQLSLDRTYSQSSLASSDYSFCSSTLREPDVKEFLDLSDDDIAETAPENLSMDDLSIAADQLSTSALLTLSPPRASRPATAAAFEAARIARRYDFDLVYVANLWPDTSRPLTSLQIASNFKPMAGRLLAAHGLHHVPSPLQVSVEAHTTYLKAHGWVEYQKHDALPNDLARGFGCAFYTGQFARSTSSRSSSPVSGIRLSEKIDRGIVFAAYRKPRNGENKLGRNFTEYELGELHRDAEALVEMLIDIHVAHRNRQPLTRNSLVDETGPIPLQQIVAA